MSLDRWLRIVFLRLRTLVFGPALDRDLDDELRFHIDQDVAARIAAGQTAAAARREAIAALRGLERRKEECRDARGLTLLRDAGRDVIGAVRMMRRAPAFTGLAISVLALGIGVNTAMFTIVNAVLFQPLRLPDPDRLVLISLAPKDFVLGANIGLMEPFYLDVHNGDQLLDGVAAFGSRPATLSGGGEPVSIMLGEVTPAYFSVLKVSAATGRALLPGDDDPARDAIVVLSDELWRSEFAGRADIVGTRLTLDGISRRIVGVMPATVDSGFSADAWVPTIVRVTEGNASSRPVVGRLKPASSIAQLRDEVEALTRPTLTRFGEDPSTWTVSVVRAKDFVVGDVRLPLLIFGCAVGLVLLIACSNVASLFLARTVERSRELAVRAALGASRGRIVRQLLTESVVVSLLGGALGLLLVFVGTPVVVSLAESLPRAFTIHVDSRVFAFTFGLSLIAGGLFGIAPALGSRRTISEIAAPGRVVTARHDRWHGALVIVEVALSLVLLTGAGLMAKSVFRMRAVNPGFDTNHLATLTVDLPASRYRSPGAVRSFHEAMLTRLAVLPAVRKAAAVNLVPFGGNWLTGDFTLDGGRRLPPDYMAYKLSVSPGYFATMGIRLRAGRDVTPLDRTGAPGVVIASASLADQFWPGQDPIGQRISEQEHPTADDWLTIVGVVDDVKLSGPQGADEAAIYRPYLQVTQTASLSHMTFVLRTVLDPYDITPEVRAIVRDIDRNLSIPTVISMEDLVGLTTATPEFHATLLAAFAATALVLTIVGIYGVLAYSVSQRTREFGIRMALGANHQRLVASVIRRSLMLTAIGITIGGVGALGLTRVLGGFLFKVTPTDPSTFVAVALLLLVAAIAASAIPAMRASRVDPVTALRAE